MPSDVRVCVWSVKAVAGGEDEDGDGVGVGPEAGGNLAGRIITIVIIISISIYCFCAFVCEK